MRQRKNEGISNEPFPSRLPLPFSLFHLPHSAHEKKFDPWKRFVFLLLAVFNSTDVIAISILLTSTEGKIKIGIGFLFRFA